MNDQIFAWELLYNNLKKDIKKKEDVLLILVHYSLIKCGFVCMEVEETENQEKSTELLPRNWNTDNEYKLKYLYNEKNYSVCSSHMSDSTIIINLMLAEPLKVTNVIFNFDDIVEKLEGPLTVMIPSYKKIMADIHQNLVSPFLIPEKSHIHTQTNSEDKTEKKSTHPLLISPKPRPDLGILHHSDIDRSYFNPLATVGRTDLDPFSIGSGGMLFDPFKEGRSTLMVGPGIPRLPRGAVPPGARFDPFGPPDRNFKPGRNILPPDYDDMFS